VHDSSIVKDSDIGSAVQAYNANYLTSSAVGSSVQAYDSNLTSFVSALTLPTSDGSADQVLKTDGSGTLSFTTLSSGGGSFTATASGSLSDGSTVIVNSDGTVSVVAETTDSAGFGSATVFESATSTYTSATFDSNSNKVVIAYRDSGNSSYGTAIVGTVSGTSISFGTPVVFESANTTNISSTFDSSNNKIVIVYSDGGNSSYGTAVVGTVSGTSISFGTPVVFESDSFSLQSDVTFDSANNKVVIVYSDGSTSYGTAVVGTVSGTSISFGSDAVFESDIISYPSATFDSANNKVVISYRDSGNSKYGTAVVGTVSGTSISFGTPVVFESAESNFTSATFDSNSNKVVIAYRDGGNSDYGTAVVGTVSGTSISFGTPVVFETSDTNYPSATFDSANNKIVIAYSDGGNSYYGTAVVGTVSGTSISFGTPVVFESADSNYYIAATFDSNSNKAVIAYKDSGNSNYGTAIVYRPVDENVTNLTAENFVGISSSAVSDGGTATIQIGGSVDDAQSGLTAGQSYFVQEDGTLGLSPDTIPVFAGTALSATELLIKGNDNDQRIGSSVQAYDSNLTSFVNTFTLPTSDGSANQVLQSDGSGTLSFTDVATGFEKSYRYSGTLATNTGSLRLYLHKAATLSEINLFVQTAPSGSAINLDINKNGSSIATPSIADGQTSNTGISANVSFAVGDYITVDIDQVGSGTAGSDLYAVLTFT